MDIDSISVYFYFLTLIVLISALCAILAHIIDMILPSCDEACYIAITPVVFIGISYLIMGASIWGAIPDIINSEHTGIGFGVATCF